MPGLLRGVARTAVVAGTATAVSNRVSRRQANRWADQDQQAYEQQQQQYAPPPQPVARSADGSKRASRAASSTRTTSPVRATCPDLPVIIISGYVETTAVRGQIENTG